MMKVSVVVPTKNEEKYIGRCIDSIIKQSNSIEIIVIDNGSTDKTIDILREYNGRIRVFKTDLSTISDMRNYGVKNSSGEWIAFVDGDVELSDNWYKSFLLRINTFINMGYIFNNIVTGSTYVCPSDSTWIEKVWYGQLAARNSKNKYINSGNLIVNKEYFLRIGGFDPKYATGEDIKFCEDAKNNGGIIINDDKIKAIHNGYPKTIKQFFMRERWHGIGMKEYINKPWKSRSLLFVIYYMLLLILLSISMLYYGKIIIPVAVCLSILVMPSILLSTIRSNNKLYIIPLAMLYFLYGWARLISVIDILFDNKISRKK